MELIRGWSSGQRQLHQPRRIKIGPLPANRDMKMWAGGAAGASAKTDNIAAPHHVTLLHFEFGKMQIEGEESLAVIEDDEVALKIHGARQEHGAGIHGGDGCSGGDAEIKPLMRTLRHAVEDTL